LTRGIDRSVRLIEGYNKGGKRKLREKRPNKANTAKAVGGKESSRKTEGGSTDLEAVGRKIGYWYPEPAPDE